VRSAFATTFRLNPDFWYPKYHKTSLLKMRFGSKKQKSNQRCKSGEYFIKDAFEN
jgi:hypothetical protein